MRIYSYYIDMKIGNSLKPQDLLVLLKIITTYEDKPWSYSGLAKDLGMSQSEVHSAIRRAEIARLYDSLTRRPIRRNLAEYLISGVRYAYPAVPGSDSTGMPTAHSAPPLDKVIVSTPETIFVWPSRSGKTKGRAINPLYIAVPKACAKDEELYQIFALVDALRIGKAREVELAKKILQDKLGIK